MHTTPVWLIGLRLDPNNAMPTFYTLLVGEEYCPVLVDEYLLCASTRNQIEDVARMAALNMPGIAWNMLEVEVVCDLAESLYLIESSDEDETSTILNCLNILFDLIKATQGSIPIAYRPHLLDLADHMTFNRSFKEFFKQSTELRSGVIDGLMWCVGWVMTHTHFLQPNSLNANNSAQ